jgi:DNA-binding winged helix-turn-helix (wHTH) protein
MRVCFGPFAFDAKAGELREGGRRTVLQGQPHKILVLLLDHPGEVVTRADIQRRLWPDGVFVGYEVCISQAVSKLRRALHDSASRPQYIETVGRRGYRLKVPVTVAAPTSTATGNGSTVLNYAPVELGSAIGVVAGQDERKALAEVLLQLLQVIAYLGSSLQQTETGATGRFDAKATAPRLQASLVVTPRSI